MVETVGSVVVNTSVLRHVAEQSSTARSFAANPENIEAVARAPVAPYISPYISVDNNYRKAVIQIRDSDTGDVLKQFPSESTLRARRIEEAARLQAELRQIHGGGDDDGAIESASSSGGSAGDSGSLGVVTVVQASDAPSQSLGAGVAQAAIAALSIGAQAGQPPAGGAVSLTA
ncbi:MAG: flagellar protein FlaG [Alphaproteobacteria bacterium]|nr:flagellar protein FlaG [Alphaproteobacteria bacterium]